MSTKSLTKSVNKYCVTNRKQGQEMQPSCNNWESRTGTLSGAQKWALAVRHTLDNAK
ncbi:hypothetical protein C7475_102352 [Chitinophaga sp. S165]|nr:hypothetical protein C7475_102352 [Chitinophaga sp. S165]